MKASDIKAFIAAVGENANYWLFGDNAINLYGKYRNGYINVDESKEKITYIGPSGNTMADGKQIELIECGTESIQYCRARLSKEEARVVIKNLQASGDITSDVAVVILNDGVLFANSAKVSVPSYEIQDAK